MANCTSEKDTLLDQIASLEAKVTKLEQENKEQKTWDTYIIVGFLEKYSFKEREWQLNVLSFFYN